MKKAVGFLILVCLLTGCSEKTSELERVLRVRSELLQASSCSFDAQITADYGDKVYSFSMNCQGDAQGEMTFTVTEPESISGVTGRITEQTGTLTFDGTALSFEHLTDEQITPVTAPWIFLKTLRSGCITSAGMEGELLRVSIDDSFEDDALHLDIWLDENDMPQAAEISYDGRSILSLQVKNFTMV